jgi:hypothetical protein
MGDEARATLRHDGRETDGKALLETDEVIFRGDVRLTIPLRSLEDVTAEDGTLTLVWAGERAELAGLGAKAERWADRIRNPRTLLDKLGVKEGRRVALLDAPGEEIRELLAARGLSWTDTAEPGVDVVLLGVSSVGNLEELAALRDTIARGGAVWVVAPKGGAEPTEAQVLAAGKQAGLVDVKVARWSDTHTAHMFVIPKADR